MTVLLDRVPRPPDWHLDWSGLDGAYDWVRALADCPQEPAWHAEGDVWTHTRQVAEALVALPAWRALGDDERAIVFLAALLHDVAKPECTHQEPDGRLTARGHARRGAVRAREILWRMATPFALREAVCGLIKHHQRPFHLLEDAAAERTVVELSQVLRCDLLALLAEADTLGRTTADRSGLLDNIALLREQCAELGCWQAPYPFDSDHARFLYCRGRWRSRHAPAFDDTTCEVTLMSGLPGAGKDHWLTAHAPALPVVALDALRAELGVRPTEAQGRVVQGARERARQHLRARRDFAWNATNLSLEVRRQVIDLASAYNARVRIVYVETTASRLGHQNRDRAHVVPERAMERFVRRWTVPTRLEAHAVVLAVTER